ncbi:hypothetical protein [Streptomyces sp. NPDC059278]|uniref:hypothetical protein n=1 Tax=Streptomyces sp. NPDC059278 TaxID=3346801 RepID=UPI0036C230E9
MPWPLPPLPVAVVAGVTVGSALLVSSNARRMRTLLHGAVMSGNPDAVDATVRRVRRSMKRHAAYVLPVVLIGISLLTAQATAFLMAAIRPL